MTIWPKLFGRSTVVENAIDSEIDEKRSVNGAASLGSTQREGWPRYVPGLLAVATAVWRLQDRLRREQARGLVPPQWLDRQLAAACDALAEIGIEAKGHTGERYVVGLALDVIEFLPTDGECVERISETIKPSVFLNGQLAQRGEVFVTTPDQTAG